jgi:catechol 2,3-dioxygenase-like lactoylglutathione lyase family enzyme
MVGLSHVALAVADPARALNFYRDIIGVEGHVRTEEYGFVIETANGVAFTLFRGQPPADVGEFHLGVALPDSEAVRGARRQFRSIGLVEHSWCEEPDLTSVKVIDPDGYVVEVFAENDA